MQGRLEGYPRDHAPVSQRDKFPTVRCQLDDQVRFNSELLVNKGRLEFLL